MAVGFLDEVERARFTHFPAEIDELDLNVYFGLTPADFAQLAQLRGPHNRLGWALQLGALRYMGFFVEDLQLTPPNLVKYVADQLNTDPQVLTEYGRREQTRTDHTQQIQAYLQFSDPTEAQLTNLAQWLQERALEHDRPLRLLGLLAERFKSEKLMRPGVNGLERMVAAARQRAYTQTYQRLVGAGALPVERRDFLMSLLRVDSELNCSRLEWLRQKATTNTPRALLATLQKVNFLRSAGVAEWDLSSLNPNRRKWLAQLGHKTTPYLLLRMHEERRYPLLLAFAAQRLADLIDETLQLFMRGPINQALIVAHWDEILRVVGSLQMGYVSASLLISRLQALPQQNAVAKALIEYGRLVKTIFILRYLESKPLRHRIERQLNKGENLHALRSYILYGNHGELRQRESEETFNQVSCLNLVVNCCVVWNTIYMGAVMEAVRGEGIGVEESDFQYLSPARYEHINVFGRYSFEEEGDLSRENLRPLRAVGYGTTNRASANGVEWAGAEAEAGDEDGLD